MMQDNTAKPFLDPILVSLMKKEVSRIKDKDQPVNRAFEVIAEKSGLKFNTVRNYYYRYIHEKDNKEKASSVNQGAEKSNGDVAGSTFTDQEVRELMMAMLRGQAKGQSVRGCANELAGNDNRLMLRYQNKYRNVLSGNPEYVENLMREMSNEGLVYYNPLKKQVVKDGGVASEGELFDTIGRLVSNINEMDNRVVDGLLRGLQELSEMAVQYKRLNEKVDGRYKERLEQAQLLAMINQLIAINRNFLNLPPSGKLTGLSEYIRQVEGCIKNWD